MTINKSVQHIGKRYILLDEIGQGGMGIVYRAKDRLTGHDIALKRVLTDLQTLNLDDTQQAENFRLALAREFKLSASLRHPNIVNVLDYGFDDEQQPYFTMGLLHNTQTIVDATQSLTISERLEYIVQMLYALSYLHRRGIIHRDLKPANVLVENGRVKVLDFGLSVMHERNAPEAVADTTAGTLAYIAPEILTGAVGSISADLYAVGMMAYEIIAGEHPFNLNDPAHLINQILMDTPSINDLDISIELATVLTNLVKKDPSSRYQSAIQTIDALYATIDIPRITETVAIRESFLQAARFVERETEMSLLIDALNKAINGEQSTWLIAGESGVGKSRIIDELRTQAMVNGAIVMRGQAVSVGGRPYEMWQSALRWLCLLDDHLSENDIALMKAFIPDADNLISRDVSNIDTKALPPEEMQSQMLQLMERVLRESNRCVVMLFEDIHWAGSESLQALTQWIKMTNHLPFLILASYRDDEKPNLHKQFSQVQTIKLGRLDNAGIAELSAAMLGDAGRTPQVVDLLWRETEGNVFFIVEVVRALAEQVGNLEDIGVMTLPSQVFAGGVQAVVERRLSQLDADSIQLLRYAAVIGRELKLEILAKIMPNMAFDEWLANGINASVLELNNEVYQFAHDKLRVGLLETIDAEQLRKDHNKIAAVLETLQGDTTNYVNALAYHWGQAGNLAKEERYVTYAGEQSLKIGAYHEAIEHFVHAKQLVTNLDLSDEKKKRKYVHLCQRSGDAYLGFGNYEKAKSLYQESLELCQSLNDDIAIAVSLGHLGNVEFATEKFSEAQTLYYQALELYRGTNNQAGIARTLNRLGDIAYELGDQESANTYYQQSLQISREIGEDWGMAGASGTQTVDDKGTGTSVDNLIALLLVGQERDDRPFIINTLMRLSRAYIKNNHNVSALELLASILHFKETPDDVLDDAEQMIFVLQEKLEQPVAEAAWEAGKDRKLDELLTKLLS